MPTRKVTIERKLFENGVWTVNVNYEDGNGGRSGQMQFELPESASDDDLKQAVIAAYA